ncbi:hypothetical protein RSAG8_05754, partial [Rhizoctonia solani AG-8 WAC10335]
MPGVEQQTDYEKVRQQNMLNNEKLLQDLMGQKMDLPTGLAAGFAVLGIAEPKPKPKKAPKPKTTKPKVKKEEEEVEREGRGSRRSARQASKPTVSFAQDGERIVDRSKMPRMVSRPDKDWNEDDTDGEEDAEGKVRVNKLVGRVHDPKTFGLIPGVPIGSWWDTRAERESPFYHEYILVDLGNNTICRFDRRGDINNRANVLVGGPIPSEDTAHVIAKNDKTFYPAIESGSDLLLRMNFPKGQDILTILAICFGIQSTKATQAYSLTRYNCYFFSWMVITATARVTVDWAALAQETSLWEALVASAMRGLDRDQAQVIDALGPKNKTNHGFGHSKHAEAASSVLWGLRIKRKVRLTDFSPLVGSTSLNWYLLESLSRQREQLIKALAELILCSTVEKTTYNTCEAIMKQAADSVAGSYAAQVAQEAAIEAMIESIWRSDSNTEGEVSSEENLLLAKECTRRASDAIYNEVTHNPVQSPTSMKPETAWDETWNRGWIQDIKVKFNTSPADTNLMGTCVSARAKAAWVKAWIGACQANSEPIALISRGVADYVTENLPETLPEVLQYGTETSTIKTKGSMPSKFEGSSNSKLQEWVKARILEHCQRMVKLTAGAQQPSSLEFEDTMRDVWGSTVRCLFDKPAIEAANKA